MYQLKINKQITKRESISIDKYLSEISKVRLLTTNEEVILAKRIKKGDKEALNSLTKANLRFVVSVAKQYQNQGLTLDDLINEGNLGLIKAAENFDETLGFKFISYAVWWIRQAILQALTEYSRIVRLPLNKVSYINKIGKIVVKLEQLYGRDPLAEEIGEIIDLPDKEVRSLIKLSSKYLSIDEPLSGEEEISLLDMLENNEDDPDALLMKDSFYKQLKLVTATLNKREERIIYYYFGLNKNQSLTLEAIGSKLNLTRERVRQIKEIAIKKLQSTSSLNSLKSYL